MDETWKTPKGEKRHSWMRLGRPIRGGKTQVDETWETPEGKKTHVDETLETPKGGQTQVYETWETPKGGGGSPGRFNPPGFTSVLRKNDSIGSENQSIYRTYLWVLKNTR